MEKDGDNSNKEEEERQRQRARKRGNIQRMRERDKQTLISGTEEGKKRVKERIERQKLMRRKRERKTIDNSRRIIKPSGRASLVERVNTRSSSRSVNRSVTQRENGTNGEVSDFFTDVTNSTNDVEKLLESAKKKFVWLHEPKEWMNCENEREVKEITMWYRPCLSELHKWVTIKKSGLVENESDMTEGYGLFSERHFKEGDVVSIYLGEYVDSTYHNEYCLDQIISETETKRISVYGGYPTNENLYLGAHMVNDINWGKKGEDRDEDGYNIVFHQNLLLVATKDINPGDELFVNYNYEGNL